MSNTKNLVQKKITDDVNSHDILMYIKGNRSFPQCGFSKYVMEVFTSLDIPFETRDVLEDPSIREGIKQFTQWPTIPQIFVKGQFIGGCDIIRELYEKNELETKVKDILNKP